MPRAGLWVAGLAVPAAVTAPWVIPLAYGGEFRGAVVPAQIIVAGLLLDGVAGVVTGFLYGVGRPGLNSWAMGAGLVLTVALDLLLIPPFGVTGAAVASAVAYLAGSLALLWFFGRLTGAGLHPRRKAVTLTEADAL
jgi:O-antigen/teichoic acid export membrane protein